MRSTLARYDHVVLLAAVLCLVPCAAGATSGSAALTGTSRLGVRGCGADRGTFSGTLLVRDDGTWSIQSDTAFSGTYAVAGRTGRKLRLSLDAASMAAFIASVEADVTSLCESAPATVTSSRAKTAVLVLNRRMTKSRLVVVYTFRGTAGGRSGTATYRLTARGSWTQG